MNKQYEKNDQCITEGACGGKVISKCEEESLSHGRALGQGEGRRVFLLEPIRNWLAWFEGSSLHMDQIALL